MKTDKGLINLVMNEYAYYGKGNSIHSSGQIEHFKHTVNDKSVLVGGSQSLHLLDGYALPLICKGGLMYLQFLGKPTDSDLACYPSVRLTSPHEWDPSVLDYTHPDDDGEPPWAQDLASDPLDTTFDHQGQYTARAVSHLLILADTPSHHNLTVCQHKVSKSTPDYNSLRPYFGWVNAETIRKTFEQSTQWGVSITNIPMRRHLKSRNPALNVPRRLEAVATDTIFSDTPAIDSGVKIAQLFVGHKSLVSDVYPMKSGKQFVNTLEDNIRFRGAMSKLLSDSARNELSNKVKDILRAYHISNWQSEPYHQNQNPAEGRYRTIKAWTNTIMNRTGSPAHCWLLCLEYVCYLLNHIACDALNGQIPLFVLSGITPDISILLLYIFYQPVYYATHDQSFPAHSEERSAFWVGFGEHVGPAMTHKLLDCESSKVVYRSAVRPQTSLAPNKRADEDGGESAPDKDKLDKVDINIPTPKSKIPTIFIRSRQDNNQSSSSPMPSFNPDDLIGKTYLQPPEENGERFRAKVTKKIIDQIEDEAGQRIENINYLIDVGNGRAEEIISYNQLLDHLQAAEQEDAQISDGAFQFRDITGHQGPLSPHDPDWKGSSYNVQVVWETGEIT